jgi:hypothetical protein
MLRAGIFRIDWVQFWPVEYCGHLMLNLRLERQSSEALVILASENLQRLCTVPQYSGMTARPLSATPESIVKAYLRQNVWLFEWRRAAVGGPPLNDL